MTICTAGKSLVGALMLAVLLVPLFSNLAWADRGDRAWHMHEMRMHRWHEMHPVVVPGYVAAPPVIVAAPPPPPPVLNLIIPLHIS